VINYRKGTSSEATFTSEMVDPDCSATLKSGMVDPDYSATFTSGIVVPDCSICLHIWQKR